MRCKDVKRLLSSYIDGEISMDKKKEVEEHLSYCYECRKELIILRKILKEIHNIPEVSPSENFSEKLWIKYISQNKETSLTNNLKRFLLFIGATVIFVGIIFVIRAYINNLIKQSAPNHYLYYELHGKMLTSTFTHENNLVDLILYKE